MQKKPHKGYALLVCPYCHAKLIKRYSYLICRYHKIGFKVGAFDVNFQWSQAKPFNLISELDRSDDP